MARGTEMKLFAHERNTAQDGGVVWNAIDASLSAIMVTSHPRSIARSRGGALINMPPGKACRIGVRELES